MPYRVWAAGRSLSLAKWYASWACPRGWLGAEDQAWHLALELEAAQAEGTTVACAALDWSKAYDSISLALLERALSLSPIEPALWRPALQVYSAPRRLRVRQAVGEFWAPSSGLLPGCALAGFFLAVLTHPWYKAVSEVDSRLSARLYVDDATLWATGAPSDAVALARIGIGVTVRFEAAFGWVLHRIKSNIFASTPSARQALDGEAGLKAEASFLDLGVRQVAGAKGGSPLKPGRVKGALGRLQLIARLPLPFRARCLMAQMAGTAAACFGMACGRPPAGEVTDLRRAARAAIFRGSQLAAPEILFTVLHTNWRLDPEAVSVLQPLWMLLRSASRGGFPGCTWDLAASAATAQAGRSLGPAAAVVMSLQQLGFRGTPLRWELPHGEVVDPVVLGLKAAMQLLVRAWQRHQWAKLAVRRAEFAPLAEGVDLKGSLQLLRASRLERDAAAALRGVMMGDVITETRAKHWNEGTAVCPHCQQGVESLFHRFWQCPCWAAARALALGAAVGEAEDFGRRLPAVAVTGLVPVPPVLAALRRDAESPRPWPTRVTGTAECWTDGACASPHDPWLARAAWAAVFADGTVLSGPVSGAQTAQRAELTAVVAVVMACDAVAEIVTDSQYVCNTMAAIAAGPDGIGPHEDLWAFLRPRLRRGELSARWMPAHLDVSSARVKGVAERDRGR